MKDIYFESRLMYFDDVECEGAAFSIAKRAWSPSGLALTNAFSLEKEYVSPVVHTKRMENAH